MSGYCGVWLAWAGIAVPAYVITWSRPNVVISAAMSVSRIREWDAAVFSTAASNRAMACSSRFCTAPRSARVEATHAIAVSMSEMARSVRPSWRWASSAAMLL